MQDISLPGGSRLGLRRLAIAHANVLAAGQNMVLFDALVATSSLVACIMAVANDHIDIASKLWLSHALWEDSIT